MNRLLFVFLATLLFTSCTPFLVEDSYTTESENDSLITPSESRSVTFSSSNSSFQIPSSTSELNISGDLGGKKIYYAVVNTLSKDLASEYIPVINSHNAARSIADSQNYEEIQDSLNENDESTHCYAGYNFHPAFKNTPSKAIIDENFSPKEELVYEVGITSKMIYTAERNNTYALKNATLWACNDVCNVWIINDDCYIRNNSQKLSIAQTYAEKFKSLYPLVRNVFGKESDRMYTSVYGTTAPIANVSNTGSKVNIVVYDLFKDYSSGSVVGFFSSMDYYKNGLAFSDITVSHSNEGKYFYIDSYYAYRNINLTISTLAHEFQHMINFAVKTMNGINCDQNFNEMLCEDMMQEYLNINDSESPKNRLRSFINSYYKTGIREYDDTIQSYANAYAFGAWVTRQYGGASLVKEMMSNGQANNKCITSAVNAINGSSFTFQEIFGQFVTSCFDDDHYTTNRTVLSELANYSYPMTAFSFWNIARNYSYYGGLRLAENENYGPAIFESNAISNVSASYGMLLKSWGSIEEGTSSVTLNFSTSSGFTNSGCIIYIYIK